MDLVIFGLLPRNTAPVGWIGVGSPEYTNAAAQYQTFYQFYFGNFFVRIP
jgi:hypothetical protein